MSLQYSNLSNPPSVLNATSSNGTYAGTLSDANTNSLNVPTSQIQSISGPYSVHRGGRRRKRSASRRKRTSQRGGRRRRQTRRQRN